MSIAENLIGKYVVVRSNRAGVFAGILVEKEGAEVALRDCRRLWYWNGAASISQIANDGVKRPKDCKFSQAVDYICIIDAIEIIPTSRNAEKIIREVSVWEI